MSFELHPNKHLLEPMTKPATTRTSKKKKLLLIFIQGDRDTNIYIY